MKTLRKWPEKSEHVLVRIPKKIRAYWLYFPMWLSGKESACNTGGLGSIPGWGRSPGEGNGNPLQYLAGYSPWGRKESDTTERETSPLCIIWHRFTYIERWEGVCVCSPLGTINFAGLLGFPCFHRNWFKHFPQACLSTHKDSLLIYCL